MSLEQSFLVHIVLIGLMLIIVLVTKDKLHRFVTAYMVCQALTWLNVSLHTMLGFTTFPVREFPKATDMAFTLQYFTNPMLCGLYVIYEPKGSRRQRFVYLLFCSFVPAILQYIQAHYTKLVVYVHYHWSMLYFVTVVIFLIVNVTVRWLFHDPPLSYNERGDAS